MTDKEKAALMGRRVVYKTWLVRRYTKSGAYDFVDWRPVNEIPGGLVGWIVGFRSLRNGIREYAPDPGYTFTPQGSPVPVVLIAPSPRRAFRRVPLDAYTLLEKEVEK